MYGEQGRRETRLSNGWERGAQRRAGDWTRVPGWAPLVVHSSGEKLADVSVGNFSGELFALVVSHN